MTLPFPPEDDFTVFEIPGLYYYWDSHTSGAVPGYPPVEDALKAAMTNAAFGYAGFGDDRAFRFTGLPNRARVNTQCLGHDISGYRCYPDGTITAYEFEDPITAPSATDDYTIMFIIEPSSTNAGTIIEEDASILLEYNPTSTGNYEIGFSSINGQDHLFYNSSGIITSSTFIPESLGRYIITWIHDGTNGVCKVRVNGKYYEEGTALGWDIATGAGSLLFLRGLTGTDGFSGNIMAVLWYIGVKSELEIQKMERNYINRYPIGVFTGSSRYHERPRQGSGSLMGCGK